MGPSRNDQGGLPRFFSTSFLKHCSRSQKLSISRSISANLLSDKLSRSFQTVCPHARQPVDNLLDLDSGGLQFRQNRRPDLPSSRTEPRGTYICLRLRLKLDQPNRITND